MKNLADIRKEINSIDDRLVELFVRRQKLADEVAASKKASGAPICDPARERDILMRVAEMVGPEMEIGAKLFFTTLFGISRTRQRKILYGVSKLGGEIAQAVLNTPPAFPTKSLVACQGAEGAYSQQAAVKIFPFPSIIYKKTFDDVFSSVENGECPYGILPIENSTAGSVSQVYDLMVKHDFKIVRAVKQKIDHVLLVPRGVRLQDVRRVVSHPQALQQCSEFFRKNPQITSESAPNTAVAAATVASSGAGDTAAIASRCCAEFYGLDVVADGIADVPSNYTRFICISKNLEIYPGASKMSFMISLPHKPGALYEVMSKFAAAGLNLTKLESRPIPGMDFEFRFNFDIEASPSDSTAVNLLAELAGDPSVEKFEFLGAYQEK